jgi:hypothetical protein
MNGGVVAALLMTAAFVSYLSRSRWRPDPVASSFVMLVVVNGLTESIVREPKDLWILLAVAFASSSVKLRDDHMLVSRALPGRLLESGTSASRPLRSPLPVEDERRVRPPRRLRKSRRTAQAHRSS